LNGYCSTYADFKKLSKDCNKSANDISPRADNWTHFENSIIQFKSKLDKLYKCNNNLVEDPSEKSLKTFADKRNLNRTQRHKRHYNKGIFTIFQRTKQDFNKFKNITTALARDSSAKRFKGYCDNCANLLSRGLPTKNCLDHKSPIKKHK